MKQTPEPMTIAGRKHVFALQGERRAIETRFVLAIEAEAVAAERARIRMAVGGLEDHHGWLMRPPNLQRWIDRAAVLRIVELLDP